MAALLKVYVDVVMRIKGEDYNSLDNILIRVLGICYLLWIKQEIIVHINAMTMKVPYNNFLLYLLLGASSLC